MTDRCAVTVVRVFALAVVVVLSADVASAAFTSATCLAAKRKEHGKLRQCVANGEAKQLQAKAADLTACTTKFQEKLAKLSAKAEKAGVACRFTDNGNSITDYDTGLTWVETASADGMPNSIDLQDADNLYTWSDTFPSRDGTVFTQYLSGLNLCTSDENGVPTFAGYAARCDWRLPTIDELRGIVDCSFGSPCIDPIFGPTSPEKYWSGSTDATNLNRAWWVDFADGSVGNDAPVSSNKGAFRHLRAVRPEFGD